MENYVVEIYEPGSPRDAWVSFSSSRPFGAINQGDILNTATFHGADQSETIFVAKVEHILFEPQGGGDAKHKIMVYTSRSYGDPEGLRK